VKLRLLRTVKRLNVEHRTPNIEHPILIALRFIYFKTSEPQNFERYIHSSSAGARTAGCSVFFINGQNTLFDVGRSMFDVRCSFFS
jgi:hypothetical protein